MTIPTQRSREGAPGRSGQAASLTGLPSLTGLRFYAATAVFLYHVTSPQLSPFSGRTAQDAAVISLDDARRRRQQHKEENTEQDRHPSGDGPVPILVVPPVRFERTLDGF